MKKPKLIMFALAAAFVCAAPVCVFAEDTIPVIETELMDVQEQVDTPGEQEQVMDPNGDTSGEGIVPGGPEAGSDGTEESQDPSVPGDPEIPGQPETPEEEIPAEPVTDELTVVQAEESFVEDGTLQSYTISSPYMTTDAADSVILTLEIPDGLTVTDIDTGEWGIYPGEVTVTRIPGEGSSETIRIELTSEIIPAGTAMEGVTVTGTLHGEENITVTGRYEVSVAGQNAYTAEFTSVTERLFPACNLGDLVLTTRPSSVDYLESVFVSLSGVQFDGGITPASMRLEIEVPDRLFADRMTLPQFEGASYTLTVNGNQVNTDNGEIYLNTRIQSFVLTVTPSDSFAMVSPLSIEFRNTVNTDDTATIHASLAAFDAAGNVLDQVNTETALDFSYVPVIPVDPDVPTDPDIPTDPDTPDIPTDPEVPDNPQPSDPDEPGTGEEETPDVNTPSDEEPEEPIIIRDLTGHLLGGTSVSSASSSISQTNALSSTATASNEGASSTERISVPSLVGGSSASSRIESTDIYEYEQDETGREYVVNRSDEEESASAVEEGEAPAEEIEQTPLEEAAEVVQENDYVPVILIIVLAAAAAVVVISILYGKKKKDADNHLDDGKSEKSQKGK